MKICFFGDAIQFHLRRWAKYFADKGHEVSVITFNPQILEGYEPVKVYIIQKRWKNQNVLFRTLSLVPMIRDIKKLVKKINPDIIHIFSCLGYSWTASLTGFHPRIITPLGSDILIDFEKSMLNKFLTKHAFKKADLIHSDGENVKEVLVKIGVNEKKIKIVRYGVDIRKFKPDPKDSDFKDKHSLQNSPIVISTRRLEPVLDIETFIKSMPLVLREIPNAKFLVAGYGSEKENLINLSKSLKMDDSVIFLGMIEESEMIKALQSSDVYVCTALSESGLAASTAEAMTCELPVINTDTGDIRLWIEDGKNGFIVPSRNPEALAKKIIILLKNENIRKEFGKKNREIIEKKNNYYKEMGKMENIYRELISFQKNV